MDGERLFPLRPRQFPPLRICLVTLYARFADRIGQILDDLAAAGDLPAGLDRRNVTVEPPRDPAHGDLATNAAMVLAKPAGTNPRDLAELIAAQARAACPKSRLPRSPAPASSTSGLTDRPGGRSWPRSRRTAAIMAGRTLGAGQRVNVEYVSANPTGPMHMGHCRGAVVGDALASLLEYAGHAVTREYYINDAGGAGRGARPFGASALPARRWARTIGESPRGFIPATI